MRQLNRLFHIAPENEASIFRTKMPIAVRMGMPWAFDYYYRLQREDTKTGKFVQTLVHARFG